jgi:hypothetical protein
VCLIVCLFVCLLVCLFVCLFVCLLSHVPVCLSAKIVNAFLLFCMVDKSLYAHGVPAQLIQSKENRCFCAGRLPDHQYAKCL